VEDTGNTFITISWISSSVGNVTSTISLSSSTGDEIMSLISNDTQYTINGLTSGTSYRISIVPSVGMCQGEGKEVMADTNNMLTSVLIGNAVIIYSCVSQISIISSELNCFSRVNTTALLEYFNL